MKGIEFPIFKTKMGEEKTFDLTDAGQRQAYFEYKAGPEIKKLQEYLKNNTFIVYLLGKKNTGKGTYSKMFKETVAPDRIEHLSVGDLMRSFDGVLKDPVKKQELVAFLQKKYRGPMPLEELIKAMEERSTKVLLPSELILALVEKAIAGMFYTQKVHYKRIIFKVFLQFFYFRTGFVFKIRLTLTGIS